MNRKKLALIAMACILCFACGSKKEGEVDFSIVPVKGSNGEYQYIDIAQKGKIVINPQFSEAGIFRDGLALVKASGEDGKWGYIDKNGKFVISPVYSRAQIFGDGVAWVQLEDQPPMLIDKNGKTVLQIDSLMSAVPFNDGIAKISVYSKAKVLNQFINKKGESVAITVAGEKIGDINDGFYSFKDKESGKWGYKNKNGETAVKPQFEDVAPFFDEMAVVVSGEKWGAIDKNGNIIINPQYDTLGYDGDGLFIAKVGKKWGFVNKKGEMVINPQFDATTGFVGGKLAPVQMGSKWAYVDKKGQIAINPQFELALPFGRDYAMVVNNEGKIGFINNKGDFVVPPSYDLVLDNVFEYSLASAQNALNFPVRYQYLGDNTSGIPREYLWYCNRNRYFPVFLDLIVAIDNEYLEIQAHGSSLPKLFYKQIDSDLVVIHKENAEDPGKMLMSVYSKSDSAYLDRNNEFISEMSAVRPGAIVATLSERSNRQLACGQSGPGVEDMCNSEGEPAVTLKNRSVYDELAKMLISIHNLFIDSPDADNIFIVFDNDTDNNKIFNVAKRANDAGFFRINLAMKGNISHRGSANEGFSDDSIEVDFDHYITFDWTGKARIMARNETNSSVEGGFNNGYKKSEKPRKKQGAGGKPRGKGQPNAPRREAVLKMLREKTR